MGWLGCPPPTGDDSTGNDKVLENNGAVGAASVGREESEFFVQRPLPVGLARDGIDRGKDATDAVSKDLSGGGVGNHAGPADPLSRHV